MQEVPEANTLFRHTSAWVLPLAAVLLVAVSTWPAYYGYSVIRTYASVPTLPVIRQQNVTWPPPEVMPILDGRGIAATPDGNLFAIDRATGRLIAFQIRTSEPGQVIVPGHTTERLLEPQSLCLGPNGLIHVLEKRTGVVRTFSRSGRELSAHRMASPDEGTIAVDAEGNLFVSDANDGVIRKFRADGHPDSEWGDADAPGTVPISGVVAMIVLDGELLAAVAGQNVIVRLNASGRELNRELALGNVGALATDQDGHIYMGDPLTRRVWLIDRKGRTRARLIGDDGNQEVFDKPRALAVPGDGNLYVISRLSIAVYRFTNAEESR